MHASPRRAPPFHKVAFGLLASYLFLAVGAMALAQQPTGMASLWYANAAAIVFLQRAAGRQWLALLLLAALANLLANLGFGQSLQLALCFVPGNVLEIAAGSWLLQRACSTKGFLVSPLEMVRTLCLAGVLPALLGSAIGATLLSAFGLNTFERLWLHWLEASVIGSFSTLPLGIFLLEGGWARLGSNVRRPAFVLAFPALLLAIWLVFTRLPFPWIYASGLLVSLTLIARWTGAAIGIFLCSVAVGIISASGSMPLAQYAQAGIELRLFLPLLMAILIPLFLACVLEKQDEQQAMIAASQRELRDLYEKTPAMLHALDSRGAIRFVSDRWLERMGYAREEVVGRKVFEFMVPADARYVQEQRFAQFQAEGQLRGFALRMQSRSKEPIEVEVSAVLLDTELAGERRALSVLEEVTERNRAREKAEQQMLLLEDVVDSVPYGMVVYDEKRNLRFNNQGFVDILRLPHDLVRKQGFNFSDLVAFLYERGDYRQQQSRQEIESRFVGAMKEWKRLTLERQQADGSFIEMEAIPLPTGWIVMTYLDVSLRKAEQRTLLESRERMQLATESSGVGLWEIDLATGELKWDAQQYRIYGLRPGDEPLDYGSWTRHLHPDDLAMAEARFQAAIQERKVFEAKFRIHLPSGELRYVMALGRSRLNSAGEVVYMVGTNRDVTAEETYAESLTQARNVAHDAALAKGLFLANMSHELRTPMNAVLGLIQLLGNTALTSNQFDYVEKIDSSARSLLGLLNDILDFSKIEAGKLDLDIRPFRVDQLMRDLAVVLSNYVGTKELDVLFDIDPRLPDTLLGDPLRLKQVLINLGGNAVKFTQVGQVVISLRLLEMAAAGRDGRPEALIEFAITDSGIGIAAENIPKMFNSFSQAEASTTRKFGGTGLGLAICKLLVELMGGSIHLQSELHRGSTFSFQLRLPCEAAAAPQADPAGDVRADPAVGGATAAPALQAPRHRVLLVDDNPVARDLMSATMRRFGWTVEQARSGEEALQRLQALPDGSSEAFSLAFVDWQLPGMDGWSTIAQLQRASLAKRMPAPKFTIVSANGRQALDSRSQEEQALINDFLVKPVTASMLYNASLERQPSDKSVRRAARSNMRVLAGVRILVVEDNAINQQVAEELLSAQGAEVSIAADGEIAVNAVAAAKTPYDLVLMDIQMPVMDGFEATRLIRQQLGQTALPIVGLTANAMASDREDCLRAGMNEHLGKPFDLAQLVSTVIRLTGLQPQGPRSDAAPGAAPGQPDGAPSTAASAASSATAAGGVDYANALARMGGNAKLYLRAAKDLLVILPTLRPSLAEALQLGDRKRCAMLLHTIKGNAATLGLVDLAALLGRLELLSRDEATYASCAAHLEELAQSVEAARSSLAALADRLDTGPQRGASSSSGPAPDSPRLQAAIARLTALLEAEDFTALEVFAQERAALEGLPAQWLQPLEAAMQELDWDSGLRILRQYAALPLPA